MSKITSPTTFWGLFLLKEINDGVFSLHRIPSLSVYGAAAGATLVYFTEWRIITDYLPGYNLKYKQDE